jgi:Fe-S oxidoreductase
MVDDETLERMKVRECLTCGRCTWACPVSRRPGDFSPRTVVERVLRGESLPVDGGIWSCTNCGMCSEICDSGVMFHEFVRELRKELREKIPPRITHGGVIPTIQSLTSKEHIRPHGNNWVTPDLEIDQDSDTLLFVGCLPLFDVVFRDFREDLLEIPRSAVRLLNAMGIKPALLEGERCCGHDAYWMGESETLSRLVRLNLEAIRSSGVRRVVTICPEGYWTMREVYPGLAGPLDFQVLSLIEMVDQAVMEGDLALCRNDDIMTYQDPCRLGRLSGIVEGPRQVVDAMGERREMERSGQMSACCGHSNWVNCDSYTREWQLQRLEEASRTGAEMLVTACPKCLIHLSCAQRNLLERMPIEDIHVLAARRLRR